MTRVYTCDSCGKSFPQAIEEEIYKDEHGVLQTLDLCAPCKNKLKEKQTKLVSAIKN